MLLGKCYRMFRSLSDIARRTKQLEISTVVRSLERKRHPVVDVVAILERSAAPAMGAPSALLLKQPRDVIRRVHAANVLDSRPAIPFNRIFLFWIGFSPRGHLRRVLLWMARGPYLVWILPIPICSPCNYGVGIREIPSIPYGFVLFRVSQMSGLAPFGDTDFVLAFPVFFVAFPSRGAFTCDAIPGARKPFGDMPILARFTGEISFYPCGAGGPARNNDRHHLPSIKPTISRSNIAQATSSAPSPMTTSSPCLPVSTRAKWLNFISRITPS